MALDLTGLASAISALNRSISVATNSEKSNFYSADELETIKAGVIQNFKIAYEMAWKFMKKWIELNVTPEEVSGVSRRQLFRVTAENRLITSVDDWMNIHNARNTTSHSYDFEKADEAFELALEFLPMVSVLLSELEKRND